MSTKQRLVNRRARKLKRSRTVQLQTGFREHRNYLLHLSVCKSILVCRCWSVDVNLTCGIGDSADDNIRHRVSRSTSGDSTGQLQLGQFRGELAYICDEEASAASGNV